MTFRSGDHLRVGRGLYAHHGIYIGENRVVQFGGRVRDKFHARIEEVDLSTFERTGRTTVVDHSGLTWLGLWELPPPFPPDRIVARARWLAQRPSEGTYNLVGRNCETVALWCTCNMAESLQRQVWQAGNAAFTTFGGLYVLGLRRLRSDGRTLSRVESAGINVFVALIPVRVALLCMYYLHNWRFHRDVKECPF